MNYRELLELSKKYPNPFSLSQAKVNYNNSYAARNKTQDIKKAEEEEIVNQPKEALPKDVEKKPIEKMITKIHRNV